MVAVAGSERQAFSPGAAMGSEGRRQARRRCQPGMLGTAATEPARTSAYPRMGRFNALIPGPPNGRGSAPLPHTTSFRSFRRWRSGGKGRLAPSPHAFGKVNAVPGDLDPGALGGPEPELLVPIRLQDLQGRLLLSGLVGDPPALRPALLPRSALKDHMKECVYFHSGLLGWAGLPLPCPASRYGTMMVQLRHGQGRTTRGTGAPITTPSLASVRRPRREITRPAPTPTG